MISSKKRLYTKFFARDFCLPIIEIWCKAETTDPRQWIHKINPKLPYQIFIREGGIVTDYGDESGIKWIQAELKKLMTKDKNFVKKAINEFYNKIKDIKPIWEKTKPLNHKQLINYMRKQQDAWAWFEAIWWTMEMVPKRTRNFKLTQEARIFSEKMVPNGDIVIKKSLRKIFPKLGKLSEGLTVEEITTKKLPSKNELKKRLNKYAFTNGKLYSGAGIKEMEKLFNIQIQSSTYNKDVTKISGQTAYRGKVRGKVRKIMSRTDVPRFKNGEILVSPMTMPDFLPAMVKSASIVTDEGGITSHAAIIARELKKPCIIGTKIASQVLKDGDIVEVDANKGIVRKIK